MESLSACGVETGGGLWMSIGEGKGRGERICWAYIALEGICRGLWWGGSVIAGLSGEGDSRVNPIDG